MPPRRQSGLLRRFAPRNDGGYIKGHKMRPALAALFTVLLASAAAAQTADTVLFNGKVVTVDKDFSVREAIAIANGKVLATGASTAMKKLAADNARMIDLGGR